MLDRRDLLCAGWIYPNKLRYQTRHLRYSPVPVLQRIFIFAVGIHFACADSHISIEQFWVREIIGGMLLMCQNTKTYCV